MIILVYENYLFIYFVLQGKFRGLDIEIVKRDDTRNEIIDHSAVFQLLKRCDQIVYVHCSREEITNLRTGNLNAFGYNMDQHLFKSLHKCDRLKNKLISITFNKSVERRTIGERNARIYGKENAGVEVEPLVADIHNDFYILPNQTKEVTSLITKQINPEKSANKVSPFIRLYELGHSLSMCLIHASLNKIIQKHYKDNEANHNSVYTLNINVPLNLTQEPLHFDAGTHASISNRSSMETTSSGSSSSSLSPY